MAATDLQQARREECRDAVLAFLAARQKLAHAIEAVRRRVNLNGADFGDDEILAALTFLAGTTPPQAHAITAPRGATKYWQATSDGVLAAERGGLL